MQTDTLIIGQGLCGTWLSYWLQKAGADFLVIDECKPHTASKVSSGIINPITGRRMVKTWLADELLPFAEQAYYAIGMLLNKKLIEATDLVDFFSSPDRRLNFEKRAELFEAYLQWPADEHAWLGHFTYPFGYGIIAPVYRVGVQTLLAAWNLHLQANKAFVEEIYEPRFLELKSDGIQYKEITANRVIFCDGSKAMEHQFFTSLPFAFNKGEALIVEIPGLPTGHLYKKGNVIAPWDNELFWVGSNYDREFENEYPTKAFFEQTNHWLKNFVKLPFKIVDHIAAVRPTTVERRPFAGMHPQWPAIGIFNGMGTKGVSLAPYLGRQMAAHIVSGDDLMPEADVKQYSRVLQRFVGGEK